MIFWNCAGVVTGPMLVSARMGSPLRAEAPRAATLWVNSSLMEFCTSRREPAMQVCPVAAKMPEMAPAAALSRSQSSNTMLGDLPPSSSATRFMVLAACA